MHINKRIAIFLLAGISSVTQAQSPACTWPGYRGPADNGCSLAKDVPVEWSDTRNVVWKVTLPGQGWSSPVVCDGQLWVTTSEPIGQELRAIRVDPMNGAIVNNIKVFDIVKKQEQHPLNSYASPSPVIEPGRLYVHFGAYGTASIDTRSGKIIWKRNDILCDHLVGPGSSPIVYKNLLILTMDGQDVQFTIALDKSSGKTVWKTPRGLDFSTRTHDSQKSFNTPIVAHLNGRDQLISAGPHGVMAYDPMTGKEIWRVLYQGYSGSSRPIAADGVLFVNTGIDLGSLMAIRPEGTGDITTSAVLWTNKRNLTARSSPLLINGLLYLVNSAGQAKCIDTANGQEIWSQRVGIETSASPVYAGGKIYTFDQSGFTTVFLPGRSFVKIAENQLDDGCMASPAVLDKTLFVRTKTALYRISVTG